MAHHASESFHPHVSAMSSATGRQLLGVCMSRLGTQHRVPPVSLLGLLPPLASSGLREDFLWPHCRSSTWQLSEASMHHWDTHPGNSVPEDFRESKSKTSNPHCQMFLRFSTKWPLLTFKNQAITRGQVTRPFKTTLDYQQYHYKGHL